MRTDSFNIRIKKNLGEPAKKVIMKMMFPFRNSFILFNYSNKAKQNRVNLDYWNEANNLGDTLSPIVVNYMLAQKELSLESEIRERRHLYAIGSVLTAGIQDTTVWGSGVLNARLLYRLEKRKLDVRAVRGPITRSILMDYGYSAPEIYGDPAILMRKIYEPKTINKSSKFGLITHKDYVLDEKISPEILKINICTSDYSEFIDKLCSVETIISSSLHGIILAETYGVPAILLKPQIDYIKYMDYYFSTGRMKFPTANSVSDAATIKPIELPDLSELQNNLISSFPYDIFE